MSKPLALIIEDHLHTATIFQAALDKAGYVTEVINDGQVAVEQIKVKEPDIIILDLHLPNVSGREIIKLIRADVRLENTRVILATADPRLASELELWADLVLIKPISFDQLTILSKRFAQSD
jgi:DNA-binding response OmpR family regulator